MAATATKKKASSAKKTSAPQSDVETVKATAANPVESRAGTTHQIDVGALDGVSVETIDGARAEVEVKKQTFDQADIHTLIKALSQAAQETY